MKRKLLICIAIVALGSISIVGCASNNKVANDEDKVQETLSNNGESKSDTNESKANENSTNAEKPTQSSSDNAEKTSSNNKKTNSNATSKTETSNSNNKQQTSGSTKLQYKQKLKEIDDTQSDFQKANTTLEMREAVGKSYKAYDDLLNEIYGTLKSQLSTEEMNKLQKEETEWIKTRDSKAEEAADKVKGGTLEPVEYGASLSNSTRERCYELLEKYMK